MIEIKKGASMKKEKSDVLCTRRNLEPQVSTSSSNRMQQVLEMYNEEIQRLYKVCNSLQEKLRCVTKVPEEATNAARPCRSTSDFPELHSCFISYLDKIDDCCDVMERLVIDLEI
jgi:hypothetical protein